MILPSQRIGSIQALRAFAAISVMAFHGKGIIKDRLNYDFLGKFPNAGFSGVDIFFVLSGFIIFYASSHKSVSVRQFLLKRFIRIYPIYWIVTLFLILSYFMSPTPDQSHKGDLKTIVESIFLLPNIKMVSGVAWTLSYEVIFYIVFALTFFRSKKLFLLVFSLWILLILIKSVCNYRVGIDEIDLLFNSIVINFAFGCLVAFYYLKFPECRFSSPIFIVGLFLFVTSWFLCAFEFVYGGGDGRLILFGIPSALVLFGILYIPNAIPTILIHLGDASYSLYLLHGSILSLLIKATYIAQLDKSINNALGATLLFLLTISISSLFYLLIERPLLLFLSKTFLHRPLVE